jgi:hypothetical protein
MQFLNANRKVICLPTLAFVALALPALLHAQLTTKLSSESVRAFDDYIKAAEAEFDWRGHIPLDKKGVTIIPGGLNPTIQLPDALIHDWVAAVVVRNTTVEQVLAVLQSYSDYKRIYASQISESTVFSHYGNYWKIYLKLCRKAIVRANLATEYDVEYRWLNKRRWAMISHSTKVAEVDGGRVLPVGTGHGYLWRLNAYWVLEQRPEGVYIECRAISMSRDIPAGLRWAIKPMITSVPRRSLQDTIEATVRALR